jgi:hypothetical protein
MHRFAAGVLVLLLAWPALAREDQAKDKPKDENKPASPAEQYQALTGEYDNALQAFSKANKEAKNDEQRQKVFQEMYPQPRKYAPRFLELAQKYPKDPAAVAALVWVVTNDRSAPTGKDDPRAKALEILLRDHLQSDKLGTMCPSLTSDADEPALRVLLDKNPHPEVLGEACVALVQLLRQRSALVKRLKDPEEARRYTKFLSKEEVEELQKLDAAKVEAESEQLFRKAADDYLGRMMPERLESLCRRLAYNTDKGSELVLRKLLEQGSKRELQGMACLYLGQLLKQRAEGMAEKEAAAGDKVRRDSEQMLERAADQYGDVNPSFSLHGTVAERARAELFELRFLVRGKPAPEIEGEDADSKPFKLSDYRGKVVLLGFWGNW